MKDCENTEDRKTGDMRMRAPAAQESALATTVSGGCKTRPASDGRSRVELLVPVGRNVRAPRSGVLIRCVQQVTCDRSVGARTFAALTTGTVASIVAAMLNETQKQEIARRAAEQLRRQWGMVKPRPLAAAIDDIRARFIEEAWFGRPLTEISRDVQKSVTMQDLYGRMSAEDERAIDRDRESERERTEPEAQL